MALSEEWFEEQLKRNPRLSYTVMGKGNNKPKEKVQEKKSKYRSKKVYVYENGRSSNNPAEPLFGKVVDTFDSVHEYDRWQELLFLQKKNLIKELKRQEPLLIQDAFTYEGQRIRKIEYVADFSYLDENGEKVVEDAKGYDEATGKFQTTKEFVLKWKLVKCLYPNTHFRLV